MSKIRVHELAKRLSVNSKVLVEQMNGLGIEAKNHMSSVSLEDSEKIAAAFYKDSNLSLANAYIDKHVSQIQHKVKSNENLEGNSMNIKQDDNTTINMTASNPDNRKDSKESSRDVNESGNGKEARINKENIESKLNRENSGSLDDRKDNARRGDPEKGRPSGGRRSNRRPQNNNRSQEQPRNRPQGQSGTHSLEQQNNNPQDQQSPDSRPQEQQESRPQDQQSQSTRSPEQQNRRFQGQNSQRQDFSRNNRQQGQRYQGERTQDQQYNRQHRYQNERGQGDRTQDTQNKSQSYQNEGTVTERSQDENSQVEHTPEQQDYRPRYQRYRNEGSAGERSNEQRPQAQSNRPQGQPYQRNRTQNQRYQGERTQPVSPDGEQGQEQQSERPQDRQYQGNRPQGQQYQGNRPQGQQYQGNRPQGQQYQGNRPQGQQYQGNRPQGQQYQGNRPQYQGNRSQGQQYQGDRPQGQQYQGDRSQGQQYQGDRSQGQQYQGNRPQGQQYQGNRPQGQQYQGNRPQGQQYQGNRPQGSGYQGNRPQGSGYQGNRPQGSGYQGNRPQGSGYQGNRPQGSGYQGGYNRPSSLDDKIKAMEKSKDRSAVPTTDKTDKDHNRRLNKPTFKNGKKNLPKTSERPLERPTLKSPFKAKTETVPEVMEPRLIQIPAVLTIKELAEIMTIAGSEVIKGLIKKGEMLTLNQEINFEKASEIAESYNFLAEEEVEADLFEENFYEEEDLNEDLTERPPVVVVMGHVDHGKTSLLDCIRHSKVISSEAGGITQHIGAYTVEINDKIITFLDTPGHEAFTAMRMRGAQITDIAVLVVAADDGVMPQTIEAINHAKAANVEIIVAINKIDKPSANPERVKRELTEYGLLTEEWGGETVCVQISALNNIGIDQLLEMITITAELKELKANSNKNARGTIIDAKLDKGRGPVATVLVQSGTLKVGDPLVAGRTFGKIRAMMDDKGKKVKSAGPSIPVEILGLSEVPQAGDMFYVAANEKHARHVSEAYIAKGRAEMTKAQIHKVSRDDLFSQIQAGLMKDFNIILKADVQGSVEALKQSLEKLSNEEVRVRILHSGVGAINESDVMLASTSGSIVIGFNVRSEIGAKHIASEQDVDIRLYRVIYSAIEDVENAMKGLLDPIFRERVIGHAEIRKLFKASSIGTIGGSYVLDGKFLRNAKARIMRDGSLVYEGAIETLKRFKDDVKEVAAGFECGLLFNKFNDIKEGDIVEAFVVEEVAR